MLGRMIVNTALQEDFSLEYDGKPVATIHKSGFADPTYAAKCDYLDNKIAEQMLRARHFDIWVQSERDAGKEPTADQITAMMEKLGLEDEYYRMRHGNLWVTKDYKGVVRAINIVDMDNKGVRWYEGDVIFRPKTLLPHWLNTALGVIAFIVFIVGLSLIHNIYFSN